MSRYAYVNGSYIHHEEASVHIEDRGFQFGDSIYEVVYLHKGRLIDQDPHLDRMERSLGEIGMEMPMSRAAMKLIIQEMVRKNRLKTGLVYIQVTRGSSTRDFPFPKTYRPTVVMTARRMPVFDPKKALKAIKVKSVEDIRWGRCDIKTTQLLAAAFSKQIALDDGFDDAWMVDQEGFVTEGTSNNAWIVTKEGKLKTRKADHDILNGITRQCIIRLAKNKGMEISEEAFTIEEALNAKEAFVTSASACLKPVTQINDQTVGNGEVGLISSEIAQLYADFLEG
ncbi:D-amino acid aminotransferase [Candidatus Terasakiella magnetica]|uniref:Probable branched-chain-amino-acid aminotransferase n=1 Tax=Candidatus Terasakiella magnetica TaxID=1867952 RepID=A0A1C3RD55_9PROT|nr:D-amino-acid transaminase [Candidatus Terasakiella magnetica]SCA55171.1 D-amino acid aminotransferase [Candidatus Terasakiella magnetica]